MGEGKLKRAGVLLLGDSISLGYREYVRYRLSDFCNVIYPKEQGKYAADIFRMLYEWNNSIIAGRKVNFIYWNAGLWDVVRIYNDKNQTSKDVYGEYLGRTCERFKKLFPEAKVCFATTSAVFENRYEGDFVRYNNEIQEYNAYAISLLKERVDCIDDLYGLTQSLSEVEYADATHFNSDANRKIGNHIEQLIRQELSDYQNKYCLVSTDYNEKKVQGLASLSDINKKQSIVCWGMGEVFENNYEVLNKFFDIRNVIDRDHLLWGAEIHGVKCLAPEELPDGSTVVITTDSWIAQGEIREWCIDREIICYSYDELLEEIWPIYETDFLMKSNVNFKDADPFQKSYMHKYIGLNITENNCNFDCEYCYLSVNPQRRFVNKGMRNTHIPQFVRKAFGIDRIGGSCLIGITGTGETMLADGINEVCLELLKEGHYLHIVTNGTYTNRISELIRAAGNYARHIIFKLSFHYIELKKRNLLDRFCDTVNEIKNSQASYTIELMPYDNLVDYIPEIKEYSLRKFGAYPQLTIGRDERRNTRLLSSMSFRKYIDTWKDFESEMFDFRESLYMLKGRNCYAGPLGFFVDLRSGNVKHCVYNEVVGNIYLDEFDKLDLSKVGNTCPLPYCFNCHVYAALGILPIENLPTYGKIRDRITEDGEHWIKKDMFEYLNTKLYQTYSK